MSTPDLHVLASAISRQSPAIRNFALAVADILQPAAPPPPPPATTRIGNGLFLDVQGNSFGTFTEAQLAPFGLILSGSDKASNFKTLEAAHPTLHGLLYHTIYETGTSIVWPGGVTVAQAQAGGWLLRDVNGNPITDPAQGFDISDPGNLAYEDQYAVNIAGQLALCPRLFIDNADGFDWWGKVAYANGVALTDADIANHLIAGLTELKAKTKAYICANAGPNGSAFIGRLLAVVDAICLENYTGTASQQQTITQIQSAGRDPVCIMPTGVVGSSAAARQYAQAFSAVWDRKGGGIGLAAPEPVNVNWTSQV